MRAKDAFKGHFVNGYLLNCDIGERFKHKYVLFVYRNFFKLHVLSFILAKYDYFITVWKSR